MAYGPLCQCAFMSYGPRIQLRAPPIDAKVQLWDKKPDWEAPQGCEAPAPGAYYLMAFDMADAKADAASAMRSMPLDDLRSVVIGSSQNHDGQVHDGHKSVNEQQVGLFFIKGKWHIKAINGTTHLESMTLHTWLRDPEGAVTKRYTSAGTRKIESIQPMDPKKRLSREMCVFRCGDSDRRFWIHGPLPLKEGEMEEAGEKEKGGGGGGEKRGRDRERGDRDRDRGEKPARREKERARSRTRSRSRSEGRRRRK